MSLVVDANILVAQVLEVDYSASAREKFRGWVETREALYAPSLLSYEIVSALNRYRAEDVLTRSEAEAAMHSLFSLGLRLSELSSPVFARALYWAEQLERKSAYDAAYLALAEDLQVPFWTADGKLGRNARSLGVDWVHWIT